MTQVERVTRASLAVLSPTLTTKGRHGLSGTFE